MTKLEDDVYSFGFILLEALVGPSIHARREAFLLNEMVCTEILTTVEYIYCFSDIRFFICRHHSTPQMGRKG